MTWRTILITVGLTVSLFGGLSAKHNNDTIPCAHARGILPGATSPGYDESEDHYDVIFYHLDLEISDTTAVINGSTRISVRAKQDIDTIVFELGNNKTVDSVFVDGLSEYFTHRNDLLFISLTETVSAGELIPVVVYYRGGSGNTGFFGGMNSKQDHLYGIPATYSLSEPFEAKDWFPCKQNLHDKADSVWVDITVDTSLMAGSNGLLTGITNLPGGKHRFEWKSRYPIAFYLISVAVSDYVDYRIYAHDIPPGDSLLIQNFIYDHPDIFNNVKSGIDETVDMIEYFSQIFGIYPFYEEKYGHSMAPMAGGMEHQTMTTLRNFNFELVAHELAHQWFGDHVTCASWRDIWINEGFASYSEYLALEHLRGKNEAIAWMTRAHDYAVRKPDGSIYLTEEEARDVYRIFDYSLSYKKGAAILHMLRYELDDDSLFFNILKKYRMAFADSVATGEDFNHWVNRVSGRDMDWFFNQWYYGKGFPVVQTYWRQIANNLILETYQFPSSNESKVFQTHLDYLIVYEDGSSELKKVWCDSIYRRYVFPVQGQVKSIESDPNRNVLMSSSVMRYFPRYDDFEVNPNPFFDRLNIVFNTENSLKKIYLTDSSGRIIHRDETKNRYLDLKLDFLENGIYILIIMEGGRKEAVRLVRMSP